MQIQTERLLLRPLTVRDLDTCNEYAMDAENSKYMLFLPNKTSDETLAFLKGCEENWKQNPVTSYEMAITLDGRHIGAVSIALEEEAEMGWVLNKAYQGKGYAFEAARALMAYAVKDLGCQRIVAHCDSRNQPSQRLMKKLGMQKVSEGTRTYPDERGTAPESKYEWRRSEC